MKAQVSHFEQNKPQARSVVHKRVFHTFRTGALSEPKPCV